tara:strand:+ start:218 stop:604 length:387 start_codon:yes stop_codon:yes gene_type:complete
MNKAAQLAAALVVTILLTIAFGAEAREDDAWFKENFTLVRDLEMDSSAFNRQTIKVYRSNRSGNCYAVHGDNNRGGFSPVPCGDFITEMDMLKEYERIEAKIAEQTKQIEERKKLLEETIRKYEESFK